jgi:hypothetical protein
MRITKYVALVLLLLPTMATAESPQRQETIAELIRATGLADMLDQSREAARAQAAALSDQMLSRLMGTSSALSAEQTEAVRVAAQRFSETCAAGFDVEGAVASWGQLYAATLTDEDLQAILMYYTSPIGQKDVAATKAAMPLWQAHLASKSSELMKAAIDEYAAELRRIVSMSRAPATGT